MKTLCLLFVFASFSSFAQVRENIKVKHQSQTRAKYVPETFKVEETTVSTQKQVSTGSQKVTTPSPGKGNDNGKKK